MSLFNNKFIRATQQIALMLLASILLVSCGGGGGGGNNSGTSIVASGVVTSAGGVVSDGSENTLVVVPPGSVTENTTITISKGVSVDGLPVMTFESSAPTGLVQIILPDPNVVGVSSVAAGISTVPIDKGESTAFDCKVDRSNNWYSGCAWFWKPNTLINGVYVNGIGNRLNDRVIDIKLSPELKEAVLRPAALLASECLLTSSQCYANKEPVLFVHGFLPTNIVMSENGFGGGGGTYDDFPQQLRASITTKDVTLFEFRWVTAAKFEDVAQDLAIAIDQIAARTGKKVHVIAHSFGGVLVRTYLQGLASGGYPYNGNVASLTTLGTPHSGLFDNATVRKSTTYQRGTHQYVGTGQTNNCKQLSCYQVGEPIDFGEESYLGAKNIDHKNFFAVKSEPGEITVSLFETQNQLPDIPIQVLIGLAADKDASILGDSVDVKDGDCLISYAGQRFLPDLMTAATIGQPLIYNQQIGNANVTEHILGFSDYTRPATTILVLNGDPERFGYRHSSTNVLGLDLLPGCRSDSLKMVNVNADNASFHDGLSRASYWISHHVSAASTPPVNIVVTGRIVDKQTGAGPGVIGSVTLRPWLATAQTDIHGRFSISLNQVTPVDNIEIVASVRGYQQGFQTVLGGGRGGSVSLPDLGLLKTGSATLLSNVMQKLAKLEVVVTGDGNGSITGQGIGCPAKCTAWVSQGNTVALTASAWRDSQFTGWSGCTRVTGVNGEICEAQVNASGTIATATFTKLAAPPSTYTLDVSTIGSGRVFISPPGLPRSCGVAWVGCIGLFYGSGTTVTLTPVPAAGSIFAGWSGGGCSGTGSCSVTMNSNIAVTAIFSAASAFGCGACVAGTGPTTGLYNHTVVNASMMLCTSCHTGGGSAPQPPFSISTTSLPSATIGIGYSQNVTASGGQVPYTWSVTNGLPAGLSINSTTGEIYGNPSATGVYNFTVTATDGSNPPKTASQTLPLVVTSTLTDTINPVVSAFSGTPNSLTLGGAATFSYTVSDSGGSGLWQAQLWRTPDVGGMPNTAAWLKVATTPLSGNGPASGTFSDSPPAEGTYWYGLHGVDGAINIGVEPSGVKVVVNPATVTPALVVNGIASNYAGIGQKAIPLSGSGFSSLSQISWSCNNPNGTICTGSPYIWTPGTARWSNVTISSDTTATVYPTFLIATDSPGTYSWSVTFSGGGQSVTKYFTVTK